jgi:hypothetical protein
VAEQRMHIWVRVQCFQLSCCEATEAFCLCHAAAAPTRGRRNLIVWFQVNCVK